MAADTPLAEADTLRFAIRILFLALLLAGPSACFGPRSYPSAKPHRPPEPPREIGPEELAWLDEVNVPSHLQRLSPDQEIELVHAIRDLERQDFGLFSTGLRRIAEMGEPVIPYLGCVEDSGADRSDGEDRSLEPTMILLKQVLMRVPDDRLPRYLDSPYRSVRGAAAGAVGERQQTQHANELVTLLGDPELEVRRAAIVSLRMISNRFYGYQPAAKEKKRREAVELWRKFWAGHS